MDTRPASDQPSPPPADGRGHRRDDAGASHLAGGRVEVVVVGLVLALFVAWAARPALAPSSVWIDDAWVALAYKADSFAQFWETTITAHGFTGLLAVWLRTVGLTALDGLAPQAPALLFGMLAPGALYVGLRRWCHWPAMPAAVAAVAVATSPLVVTFSTRVKQYTLDVLLAAVLTAAAVGLTHHFSTRRRWLLTAGGAAAVVLSAATASVAGAAVLVAWATAATDRTDHGMVTEVRWQQLRTTAAPFAAFLAFALAWQVGVLSHTVPDGMYTFWQDQFLPVDEGAGAVLAATWSGLGDVVGATVTLPFLVALALAAIGVARHLRSCPAIGAMVVLPVLTSIGLAVLQRAPWGGGRTDSHLVVALALGIGAAFFPVRDAGWLGGRTWALRPAVPFAAVVVLAMLASEVERPTYPLEDLRPKLDVLEEQWVEGEVILVYPFARLAYALYTPADVTFKPNEGSSVGYALDIEDDRVVLLPAWRRDPTQYAPIVAEATAGACGVWLPASHVSSDLGDIKEALAAAGFVAQGEGWGGDGATLSHWRHPERPC